jgi:hypothetical protein
MALPGMTETKADGVFVHTRHVDTVEELERELRNFGPDYVYRGQGDDWLPRCTLDRFCESLCAADPATAASVENHILKAFQDRAHLFLPVGSVPGSHTEWFALLQHHGGPTRMLDVTRSPYVAAFYAFEFEAGDPAVIWAFPESELWFRSARIVTTVPRSGKPQMTDVHAIAEQLVAGRSTRTPYAIPHTPRANARMAVQQGLFLLVGNPAISALANVPARVDSGEPDLDIVKIVCPRLSACPCYVYFAR